jgi:hypothetical protein
MPRISGTAVLCLLGTGVALVGFGPRRLSAQAGQLSPAQVISLAAVGTSTLTVSITAGGVQSINSVTDNSVNGFPSPVTILTAWDVSPGQTNSVELMAFFSVPSQALVGGATQIPSVRVLGRVATGLPTSFTPMTQSAVGGVGTAGGSLHLFTQAITGANKTASRTDNLELRLDLTGFPALAPGNYTGTLNLRAVTQ